MISVNTVAKAADRSRLEYEEATDWSADAEDFENGFIAGVNWILRPTHYAALDEHGEILKSRKVSDDVDDRAILQWYVERHGNDEWTVKGVTVHE